MSAPVPGNQFIAALRTGPCNARDKDAMYPDAFHRVLHGFIIQHLKWVVFKGKQFCKRDFLHVPAASCLRRIPSGEQVIKFRHLDIFCAAFHPIITSFVSAA